MSPNAVPTPSGSAPDWARGRERLQRAWRRSFELGQPVEHLAPRLDVLQARLLVRRSRLEEARSLLERASARLAEVLDHDGLCQAKLALVELESIVLNSSQADERAREALDIAARRGLKLREADAWLALAQVAQERGQRAASEHALERAQAIVDETGYRRLAPAIAALRSASMPNQDVAPPANEPGLEPPQAQSRA